MSLRRRLIALMLACGLAPVVAVTAWTWFAVRSGNAEFAQLAERRLRESAVSRLEGIRDAKAEHVAQYFDTIGSQMTAFVEDRMVVRAMRTFPRLVEEYPKPSGAQRERMAAELGVHYREAFGTRYAAENGRSAPIDRFLEIDDTALALQHAFLADNPNPLGEKERLDTIPGTSGYAALHAEVHPPIRTFLREFGYYDIFLIHPEDGRIVYSVYKELDFMTSLDDGPYRDSNFAAALRAARELPPDADRKFVLVDFEQYAPSFEAPASFICAPIRERGELLGYAAFQMPIDRVNAIMTAQGGLGETGETVLVGQDGLMRSDSRRSEAHSVVASFRHPETGRVESDAVRASSIERSVGTGSGRSLADEPALLAWRPIDVLGLQWGLVASIDESEALAAAREAHGAAAAVASSTLWISVLGMLVASGAVGAIAWYVSGTVVRPILASVEGLEAIAEGDGDLTKRLDDSRKDELGRLGRSFNKFTSSLAQLVQDVHARAAMVDAASEDLLETSSSMAGGAEETRAQTSQVAGAIEELSATMSEVTRTAEEMSSAIATAAAAVEETTANITEVTTNAENAASVAARAAELSRSSSSKIEALGEAAQSIDLVVETIRDIAEQTNLLALNATIEAARAGEAGRGFAVVAEEVKELARQTGDATGDIRRRIEQIQSVARTAVDAIREIDGVISEVRESSSGIARLVSEQRSSTQEVAESLSRTSGSVEIVSRSVEQSAATTREIAANVSQVDAGARRTAESAGQTHDAGTSLHSLSSKLQGIVGRFRL